MDKSKKLIIVIILLVVIIGGVSFYAFHQAKENKEMSELFAVEKLEMENEYNNFRHPIWWTSDTDKQWFLARKAGEWEAENTAAARRITTSKDQ